MDKKFQKLMVMLLSIMLLGSGCGKKSNESSKTVEELSKQVAQLTKENSELRSQIEGSKIGNINLPQNDNKDNGKFTDFNSNYPKDINTANINYKIIKICSYKESPEKQGKYILVDIIVTNNNKDRHLISPNDFDLKDSTGRKCTIVDGKNILSSTTVKSRAFKWDSYGEVELQAGFHYEGMLCFLAPDDSEKFTFTITTIGSSNGKTVRIPNSFDF